MLLRDWRKKHRLTLAKAAKTLGIKSFSSVWDIETGYVFPAPDSIVTIHGATNGLVTANDHLAAWGAHNPERYSDLLAAGRSAAKEHRPPASTKRRK